MARLFALLASIVLFAAAGFAQPKEEEQKHDTAEGEIPKPVQVVTHHDITINGRQIHYTATAGTFLLKSGEDKPIALIGFTAYTKDGTTSVDTRPVTFVQNGGPGLSSIWLHMGGARTEESRHRRPGRTPPAPYKMEGQPGPAPRRDRPCHDRPGRMGFSRPVGKAKGLISGGRG